MSKKASPSRTRKYPRKTAELPNELLHLTADNFRGYIKCQREDDSTLGTDVMVAHEVITSEGEDGAIILDTLTLDQIRLLCRNIGVKHYQGYSKFKCKRAIYELIIFMEKKERCELEVDTIKDVMSSNIIRLTNVIFSSEYFDDFIKLNDRKSRDDFEAKKIPGNFWKEVTTSVNCCVEDDSCAVTTIMDKGDDHYDELDEINLCLYDNMDVNTVKKTVKLLLKIRKTIQQMMTTSGEHSNDHYTFIDQAFKRVGGCKNITKIGMYYFHLRCNQHKEVDESFSLDMDECLLGNTDTTSVSSVSTNIEKKNQQKQMMSELNNDRKRVYSSIVQMCESSDMMISEMKETNSVARVTTNELKIQNKQLKKQNLLLQERNMIQIAQTLGRNDILNELLEDMNKKRKATINEKKSTEETETEYEILSSESSD
jgi:hypothetical protein